MSPINNQAAWIPSKQAAFKIDTAPLPVPASNELIIRTHAVAFNPADAGIQKQGMLLTSSPAVIGWDVAGTIPALGSEVSGFEVGDRVIAMVDLEPPPGSQRTNQGAFQLYCAAYAAVTAKLPEDVTFTQGCVLPIGLSTAAVSLFSKGKLELEYPQAGDKPTPKNGKVVLVWGGSSSVGSCAIQMVKAAGYAVATTCSAHNFDYCRDIGADWVFDHKSATVVDDIVEALQGKEFAGAFDAVLPVDSVAACGEVAHRMGGKKHVATVLPGPPTPMVVPEGLLPEGVENSYCESVLAL